MVAVSNLFYINHAAEKVLKETKNESEPFHINLCSAIQCTNKNM